MHRLRSGRMLSAWARRHGGVALAVALLPSLLYLGHWSVRVDIPGTRYYLGTPAGASRDHDHTDHGDHCHGDVAGCSETPSLSTVPVAVLAESVVAIRSDQPGRPLPAFEAQPVGGHAPGPEVPPPRSV